RFFEGRSSRASSSGAAGRTTARLGYEIHLAPGTLTGVVLLHLGMHRAGVDSARLRLFLTSCRRQRQCSGGTPFRRHHGVTFLQRLVTGVDDLLAFPKTALDLHVT